MQVSKDQSIVIQVAGKIASELVWVSDDVNINCASWLLAFDVTKEALLTSMGMGVPSNDPAQPLTAEQVAGLFATASTVPVVTASQPVYAQPTYAQPTNVGGVSVKGEQSAPLPQWLVEACAKAGINEVYDNRATATVANKRPHFKATTGGKTAKGFWPPKS